MRRSLSAAAVTALLATSVTVVGTSSQAAPVAEVPPDSAFQKVTLNDYPGEPIALAVLPDNRVLHTARGGEVRVHDPKTGRNVLAANIPVYLHDEEGVQGIAVDPNFASNHWVYVYYSPVLDTPTDDPETPVNEGDAPETGTAADFARYKGHMQLSRFKMKGNTLELNTEQQIMQVPTDRGICCHVGGKIDFDGQGNLYLSTGDDTNPFASDGYIPIDERPDRNPAYDAQRTAANTNDLRGKLLRISVKANGTYSIPPGNLFAKGTPKTKPEIYAMGLRNPFRFDVDKRTGVVYMADYSPDAGTANPDRGPAGHGRWMAIDKPANYGWPYCVQPDIPYVDYDFATGESGEAFDCQQPVNDSPNNTGLRYLPTVERSELAYAGAPNAQWPELGRGGIAPMAGPAYYFDRRNTSKTKWPASLQGKPFFYEWSRDYIKSFTLNNKDQITAIEDVLPSFIIDNPMDMEFGPDGSLYVLEYGDGYFSQNPEAQLSRIDYAPNNKTPIVKVNAEETVGSAPLTVNFTSAGTYDPDGDALTYAWDFDADGKVDSRKQYPAYTYRENGDYRAILKVTDSTGRSASAEYLIHVGPVAPVISFVTPTDGQDFSFGDTVNYEVAIEDDQDVNCANVTVTYILGHDQHGHPLSTTSGCTGSIRTFLDAGHAGADNLNAVFVAEYTDADGQTATAQVVLDPQN
ncbi:PQQ-dependent sugar dehydrogenase [Terracoccus luteus]|uniref:Glucose/arabinose dehydrogenase/PKD repeat protein n=1 Tax=Terracoccus luteus TaxID=53356 RepID=A0A839PVH2_9MICO|nr:PQQ-dependent sugar dehydrogenase [Terracoccus luteus]MBB2988248.1 glucose/arabinose dehydrogenase/PKD repeat protein [Terracoccus luteus]MCP2173883.1 glucose/arabinose dehydrogenase/PKD repeat protein [Terracoccus luteus]